MARTCMAALSIECLGFGPGFRFNYLNYQGDNNAGFESDKQQSYCFSN